MIKVGMNLPDAKTLCENYLLGNDVDFAIHQMPILEEQISKLSFALTHICKLLSGADLAYSSGSSMARAFMAHSEQGVVFSLLTL